MLSLKKVLELKIKNIHKGYDYPSDWELTHDEFTNLLPVVEERIKGYDVLSEDILDDILDHSLRIDSKTGRMLVLGYQIDVHNDKTYYYAQEADALNKIREVSGEYFSVFGAACERWNEFKAQPIPPTVTNKLITVCRMTSVL